MEQEQDCGICGGLVSFSDIIHVEEIKISHFDETYKINIGKYNYEFINSTTLICRDCYCQSKDEYIEYNFGTYDKFGDVIIDVNDCEEYLNAKHKNSCDICKTKFSPTHKKCKLGVDKSLCHICMIGEKFDVDPKSKNKNSCCGCLKWFSGFDNDIEILGEYDENNNRCRVCAGCYYSYYRGTYYDMDHY